MFYAIIFAIVVLAAAGIGYTLGVSKRDSITKTRNAAYKELTKEVDDVQSELLELSTTTRRYEKALREIARNGPGTIPEITASIALNN